MVEVAENLKLVNERIERACQRAGRNRESVTLVAVTKTRPAAQVEAAFRAGQRVFGENYVQELMEKLVSLDRLEGIEWHFIGRLQRNKVKLIIGKVKLIETVDSRKLLMEIEKRAAASGEKVDILVEINVGEEEQKAGSSLGEVERILDAARSSSFINCRGLMAIPPFEKDPEESRKWFVKLREAREKLGGEMALPELSMGMSGDFEVAIEEGATIVRVGTAIFCERE